MRKKMESLASYLSAELRDQEYPNSVNPVSVYAGYGMAVFFPFVISLQFSYNPGLSISLFLIISHILLSAATLRSVHRTFAKHKALEKRKDMIGLENLKAEVKFPSEESTFPMRLVISHFSLKHNSFDEWAKQRVTTPKSWGLAHDLVYDSRAHTLCNQARECVGVDMFEFTASLERPGASPVILEAAAVKKLMDERTDIQVMTKCHICKHRLEAAFSTNQWKCWGSMYRRFEPLNGKED